MAQVSPSLWKVAQVPTGPWKSQLGTFTPLGRLGSAAPDQQEETSEENFGSLPLKNKDVESLMGNETSWNLGPFATKVVPGYTSPRAPKYKETVWDYSCVHVQLGQILDPVDTVANARPCDLPPENLYAGKEATVRTGHEQLTASKSGKLYIVTLLI